MNSVKMHRFLQGEIKQTPTCTTHEDSIQRHVQDQQPTHLIF